ncbi:hypothetical protein RN001_007768 [Aquatica leii]|uniref:Uncharacterized protein n=1 Tax=Aquatica leii TaxID=1421715 RepID=A0AAN7PYG6_9COLE|nr:hypothetical protein RN001_007768 [Aquatica leii]
MTLFPKEFQLDRLKNKKPLESEEHSNSNQKHSIFKSFMNMFRISDSNVRSRKTVKTPCIDSYNTQQLKTGPITFTTVEKNRKVNKPSNKNQNNSTLKTLIRYVEEYFINSTLHGLHYVGDTAISFGERLFWLIAFLIAISSAAYFISNIYTKYDRSPIIISLNPKPTPISVLPFPAITICSMNQAKKQEAFSIIESGTEVEKMLLDDYCNSNSSFTNLTLASDEATKWETVQKFILRVNPSCQEMLKVCLWRQDERLCERLFNSALTDDGLCCTFNALPQDFIFKNARELAGLNLSFPPEVDDWDPETGYSQNASIEALPWRATGAGSHLGLSIVLDAQINSYYCSSSTGVGFKILLHNPIETPKMADFALLIAPGLEARVVIQPKIYDASQTIRSIDIKKRMCYFSNERDLQFYRTYTQLNCKLECQANYTLRVCGCVPFYLPKNRFKKICNKRQEHCISIAKEIMEIPNQNGSNCNCLPACFELGFEASVTFGKLIDTFKVKEQYIKNESIGYFKKNMAILHFFFTESQFTRNTKTELYGFSEFLSNTGGLLELVNINNKESNNISTNEAVVQPINEPENDDDKSYGVQGAY